MKRILSLFLAAAFLASCGDSSNTDQSPIDSLEAREDTLKKNIDSSFNTKIDSLEERKEKLEEKVDSTIEARRDSIRKNN